MANAGGLLGGDLADATRAAAEIAPDVVAALDRLMPMVASGADRATLRRYYYTVDAAARTLTAQLDSESGAGASPSVVYRLLRRDAVELPWVAPSPDGAGVLSVLVDRLRGLVAGIPRECVQARRDVDEGRFAWFVKSMADIELEQSSGSPLRRAMTTLGLSSSDMAGLMGVTRQAVDKWLLAGPPAERLAKVGAVAEIADILRYRLRDGMPAAVARRAADAYGERSMLEVIADGDHEWLLRSVRDSFDLASVA